MNRPPILPEAGGISTIPWQVFPPFDLGAEDEYNDGLDMNPAETQYKLEAPGRSWSFRELSIRRVAWYT